MSQHFRPTARFALPPAHARKICLSGPHSKSSLSPATEGRLSWYRQVHGAILHVHEAIALCRKKISCLN